MKHYGKDNPYTGSEDALQISTKNTMAVMFPDLFQHAFHVPNGGNRPTKTIIRQGKAYTYSPAGKKMKDMGQKAGVSDWIILYPVNGYHGAIIELKTKGGSLQPSQTGFLHCMETAGYFTAVCWSVDGFIEAVQEYTSKKLENIHVYAKFLLNQYDQAQPVDDFNTWMLKRSYQLEKI